MLFRARSSGSTQLEILLRVSLIPAGDEIEAIGLSRLAEEMTTL